MFHPELSRKQIQTRIFLCNKDENPDIKNEIVVAKEKLAKGEVHRGIWKCGHITNIQVGEQVFFKRVGSTESTGFFAQGYIIAAEKADQLRLKSKQYKALSATYNSQYPCDYSDLRITYEWHSVVDYNQSLEIEYLRQQTSELFSINFHVNFSGLTFCQEHIKYLEYYWEEHLSKLAEQGCGVHLATVHRKGQYRNAALEELAVARKRIEDEYLTPRSIEDARKRDSERIAQRQGQPVFRQALLEAYNRKCAITGEDLEQALEATHIMPYFGTQTDCISNGLLLRADLHVLFDLYLLTIDPETMRVLVAPTIKKTSYGKFDFRPLSLPWKSSEKPSQEALRLRCDELCIWAKTAWSFPKDKFQTFSRTKRKKGSIAC
ncbi:MAG: HNH endonuclease [Chroococcidiopsidaceae cyanobacterium CP_BM_ER_R8_30]|nr:HNH endonuclease [Chroococcidiopsidaceae cyanobacterium CP_BM_ER_R8_30]